jgi:hypothetical protein
MSLALKTKTIDLGVRYGRRPRQLACGYPGVGGSTTSPFSRDAKAN